ncbi:MAG TPA: hypothetical protein VK687_04605 [Bryobacteraceae bacterium]|jgi:hypothetical protein|nr:hypothetical protein [Bryobacteraceae bacterium]
MATPKLELRFAPDLIDHWESRYTLRQGDDSEIKEAVDRSLSAGYCNKPDFVAICRWKSHRIISHCQKNPEDFVQTVTKAALSSTNERFRIYAPTLLQGVGWRVSSVLLHFASPAPYPIIDFRALWSLGYNITENDDYDFSFWWSYADFCRKAAIKYGVSMRKLDRALWQYSDENQK